MNPFQNRCAELQPSEEPVDFRRTSGGVICEACGKEYRRHPHSEHRDYNGDPFLNVLCNGELVKL